MAPLDDSEVCSDSQCENTGTSSAVFIHHLLALRCWQLPQEQKPTTHFPSRAIFSPFSSFLCVRRLLQAGFTSFMCQIVEYPWGTFASFGVFLHPSFFIQFFQVFWRFLLALIWMVDQKTQAGIHPCVFPRISMVYVEGPFCKHPAG